MEAIIYNIDGKENIPTYKKINILANAVCKVYDINIKELKGNRRLRNLADARKQYIALSRAYTDITLTSLGAYLNDRDHSTILHSVNVHEDLIATNGAYRSQYFTILNLLQSSNII